MKNKGQSLGEYALTAALVAIVGIGACTYVVGVVADMLPDLMTRIFGEPAPMVASGNPSTAFSQIPTPLAGGVGIGGLVPQPNDKQEQLCLNNGFCINVAVVTQEDAETAGGLGSDKTALFAQSLELIANQLAATQDPEAVKMLEEIEKLANLAKQAADIQSTMPTSYYSGWDADTGQQATMDHVLDSLATLKGGSRDWKTRSEEQIAEVGIAAQMATALETLTQKLAESPTLQAKYESLMPLIRTQSEQVINSIDGITTIAPPGPSCQGPGCGTTIGLINESTPTVQNATTLCNLIGGCA